MSENKTDSGTSYNQHSSGSGDNIAGNKTTHLNIKNITVVILITGIALIVIFYSYQQYKRQQAINRQESELRNRQDSLKTAELMSSVKSAFEIKYVTLEGNAIDFLLDSNKINNAEILEVFGNKPVILTTPVSNYLATLKKQFGLHQDPEIKYEVVTKNISANKREAAKNGMKATVILPATNPYTMQDIETGNIPVNELVDKFKFDTKCIASSNGELIESNTIAGCSRFANKETLQNLLSYFEPSSEQYKTIKLYLFTAGKNKLPDDFIEMRNGSYSGGCAGEEGEINHYIRISSPVLKLKVAYIKNVSAAPIKLTDLLFNKNSNEGLRAMNKDSIGFGKADTVKYHITLLPGKSLIIPVQTYFETSGMVTADESENTEVTNPALSKYVFGNSVQIESMWINDFNFAANKDYNASEYGFYVNGIPEGASCPYVFTYDSSQQDFMKETNILYAQNKKSKEGWDTIKLKHFDGRLQIKEIDRETSFIDCIYILATDKNGKTKIYKPNNNALIYRDYSYVKLTRGNSFILNFPTFSNIEASSYSVISSGYYIPWQ
jgi:type II secretory pathway pseudopilin PulG